MSEDKYYFLNTLNLGILIINENREVVFANDWLASRVQDDLFKVGQPLILDSKKHSRVNEAIDKAIKNGMSSLLTHRLNGSPFNLSLGTFKTSYNLTISRFSKNGSKSIIIQFLDITQVKEREKYITDKQMLLDVHEQREIHQEKLNSFVEMTSRIAHEINNPLSILVTNTKLMKMMLEDRGILDDDFSELVNDADETVFRIEKLVRSVEDLAYVPKRSDFKKIMISEVVNNINSIFQPDFIEKKSTSKLKMKIRPLIKKSKLIMCSLTSY